MFSFISSKASSVLQDVASKLMHEDEGDDKDPAQEIITAAKRGMQATFAERQGAEKVDGSAVGEREAGVEEVMSGVIKEFNEFKKNSLKHEASLNKQLESLKAENEALKKIVGKTEMPESEEIQKLFEEVGKDAPEEGKARMGELRQKIESILQAEELSKQNAENLTREKEKLEEESKKSNLRFKIIADSLKELRKQCTDCKNSIKSGVQEATESTTKQLLRYFTGQS